MTSATPGASPDAQIAAAARALLRQAYRRAVDLIEAMPARAAYDAAGALGELLGEYAEDAAGLRARMAARLAREQGLTVRGLARELGVAPSNAGELLKRARGDVAARADSARTAECPGPACGSGHSGDS